MLYSHRCLVGFVSLTLCLPAGLHAQGPVGFGTNATAGAVRFNGIATTGVITIQNGLVIGTPVNASGGTTTGGGSAAFSFATASAGIATSLGSAELATGFIRTTSTNSAPSNGAGSDARAGFSDTLTFTNTTNAYLFLTLYAVIPGQVSMTTPENLFASNSTFLNFFSQDAIMVRENGVMVPGLGASIYYRMYGLGSTPTSAYFEQDQFNRWAASLTGGVAGTMSTVIGFRPGKTTLSLDAFSALDCRFTTNCNYGNTKIQLGVLPAGLSYTSASGVFLLGNVAPTVTSATPAFGQGTNMTRTVVFDDANGASDLGIVNVLINSALDGRNACYLAYDSVNNVLVLQADAGDNATVLGLPSTASLSNSQCSIPGSGITAVKTGNTMTLTITFNFTASFTGTRVVFAAARDRASANSNWQAVGTQTVTTPATNPQPLSATPSSGLATVGATFPVTATYRDATASTNLQPVQLLINRDLDGANACYFGFDHAGNNLYIVGDTGTLQSTPIRLNGAAGGAASIENTQCRVLSAGSTFSDSGNTLTMTLQIQFKGASSGRRLIYAGAQTTGGANSGWSVLGGVTVQ